MSGDLYPYGDGGIKRRIRRLKQLEARIRFGAASAPAGADLVWDAFFDLREKSRGRARYSLRALSAMGRDELKRVADEFFSHVYYRLYRENGIAFEGAYDPEMLERMGLPPDADGAAIKRRFHELALKCHPDAGGDAETFIRLMEDYRKLIDKGK